MIRARSLLRERLQLILFFAFVSALLLAPLGSSTLVPSLADFFHHINAIIEAKAALAEGQFPLRMIAPDHAGWRYPYFQFYSPNAYLIAGFIYRWVTPANPFIAYKFTVWIAYVLGGIYMYRLSHWLVKSKPIALLASLVYLMAPYNILIIDYLGGFAESVAMGFLPVVIYYTIQRYYYPRQNQTLIQMALAWYLLITLHFLTFLTTSFAVVLLLILMVFADFRNWRRLMSVGIAYLFACMLALWFLAPIFLLSKYLLIHDAVTHLTTFHSSRLFLPNLLSPVTSLAYTDLAKGNGYQSFYSPSFGVLVIFSLAICSYFFISKQKTVFPRMNYWLATLIILFMALFVLIWSPFNFWQWLPDSFRVIEYSWRLMGQTVWIGALLFSAAVAFLFKNKLDERHVAIGILIIVTLTEIWFPVIGRKYTELDSMMREPSKMVDESYLMDAIKYLPETNYIDSLVIASSHEKNAPVFPLQWNTSYFIPRASLLLAKFPFILVKGVVPEDATVKNVSVSAYMNGIPVANYKLKHGPFEWHVPMASKDILFKGKSLALTFKRDGNKANPPVVSVNKIVLGGLLAEKNVMSVKQSQPLCRQEKENTICQIDAPKNISLIELPVLFYPGLLQVTLNGKVISAMSVLHEGRIILGVHPEPSKTNNIVVRFEGLTWANWMSSVMWWLMLFSILYVLLKKVYR